MPSTCHWITNATFAEVMVLVHHFQWSRGHQEYHYAITDSAELVTAAIKTGCSAQSVQHRPRRRALTLVLSALVQVV